jgi:protein TonB
MKECAGVVAAVSLLAGLQAAPALAQERDLVDTKAPEFPRAAGRRSILGHVVVRYTVSPVGAVSGVEIVEATPAGIFERAGMRAFEDWRYVAAAGPTEGIERRFDFAFAD